MPATLKSLQAVPLTARFADIYGSEERIPDEIRKPASHFQSIPRVGQYTTLVIAESSDGFTGFGECFGLPTPYAAAEMVNKVIAPALIGKPLGRPSDMLADLRRYFGALGHSKGPGMEAVSGADIALWDLAARRDGKTLAQLLGAEARPVPTYVSPVPFLPSPEQSAAAARKLCEGYGAVKLKIGRGSADDLPHIRAVREAIGAERKLMLDANCGYAYDDALLLLDRLRELDIAWLEEPLPPEDVAALKALSDKSEIALAGGENEFTPQALARLIDEAAVDIVQPNISRAGGVSGLLEVDEIAQEKGASVAPHGVGGSIVLSATLHCASAMQAFSIFEVNRLPNPLRDEFGGRPEIDNQGNALPPKGVGHGVTVEADEIGRFAESA